MVLRMVLASSRSFSGVINYWARGPNVQVYVTPPRIRRVSLHVHDFVTHRKEHFGREGLRKEICQIIGGAHEWDSYRTFFDLLSHEEVPAVDMLCVGVVLRIIAEVTSSLVVHRKRDRLVVADT